MLRAIFFDMGGTLDTFHYTPEYRISKMPLVRNTLAKAGIQGHFSDLALSEQISQGASAYLRWNMETNRELKPADIWSRFFLKDLQLTAEQLAPIAEDLAYLYETQLFVRELRPEIPGILKKIADLGLIIGCISNTQSQTQVPMNLKEYGIIQFFDPIILSSVYGKRKPDPSIFYYAARQANVPTSACLYVGDKINRDILGARRAGFRLAVQIRHLYDNGEPDEGATPDAVIADMRELLPLIEQELKQDQLHATVGDTHKIKAIFFDAGDILYHRPQKGKNLKQFLAEKNIIPPPDLERATRPIRDLAFSGKIKRHAYYEQVLRLCGIEDPVELARGAKAMGLDDNTVDIISGVPETIRQLKQQGYILGIITDTALSVSKKLKWFERYGFGNVWDTVISSKEMGIRKPSPQMYEKAITQTGVCACDAVFVGHKKTEIDGAKAVGLHTVAFNYDADVKADAYIEDFHELLNLPLLNV
jgi:putative hydrolase of the HAD superfamily